MHGTYLSGRLIWSTWAVVGTGVILATAGWEAAGLAVWLGGITIQCVLGITVLLRRRRTRAE